MPQDPSVRPPTPASYEAALAELDRLVEQMEGGQMPLDHLLDGYRRGAELIGFCRERLAAVEEQVRVLEEGRLRPLVPARDAVRDGGAAGTAPEGRELRRSLPG